MTLVDLPPELAPSKRAAVEALLAEVQVVHPPSPERGRNSRPPCHVCRRTSGPMGGHHLVPGDDSTVVPVHAHCHVKLHARGRTKAPSGPTC